MAVNTKNTKSRTPGKERVSLHEMLAAQMELDKLREEHGIQVEEKGLKRLITKLLNSKESRQKILVNRKKYLRVMLLLGWCGGHRFLAHQYGMGILYLLFFWTGFPLAMTLVDALVAIPIPQDDNGCILV